MITYLILVQVCIRYKKDIFETGFLGKYQCRYVKQVPQTIEKQQASQSGLVHLKRRIGCFHGLTFFHDKFRTLSDLRNVREELNRHLNENINYAIKFNENKFSFYEEKVNASVNLGKKRRDVQIHSTKANQRTKFIIVPQRERLLSDFSTIIFILIQICKG